MRGGVDKNLAAPGFNTGHRRSTMASRNEPLDMNPVPPQQGRDIGQTLDGVRRENARSRSFRIFGICKWCLCCKYLFAENRGFGDSLIH